MRNLIMAGKRGGSSLKHKWTEDEKDIIRRDYDGHNASAHRIADRLGVSFCAVKGQVQILGIAQDRSPRWTEKELELLGELIHKYAITGCAKKLHRSPNAVKIKATRLKMGLRARDWYTKKDVAEILGIDHKKAQKYIDCGALKASYHNGRKPQKNGTAMWHIKVNDLKDFIINYSGDFTGRNVDLWQIVNLISSRNG